MGFAGFSASSVGILVEESAVGKLEGSEIDMAEVSPMEAMVGDDECLDGKMWRTSAEQALICFGKSAS